MGILHCNCKMVKIILAGLIVGVSAKQYARGFVRQPRNEQVNVATITDEMRAAAPASLDWSTKGALTAVKDQGDCGSCWAYSATEGIEAGVYIQTGQKIKLSEQQIRLPRHQLQKGQGRQMQQGRK